MLRISRDKNRFNDILKGKVRKNLKDYIKRTYTFGKQGDQKVTIPMPEIRLPRFTYDHRDTGGTGMGDGDVGDVIGRDAIGDGSGNAGESEGERTVEVEVTIDELAQMLGEELELPKLEPKGKAQIEAAKNVYTGISNVGPQSLRHFKRTYKQALRRQMMTGTYNPDKPVIIPEPVDNRYRAIKKKPLEENNAAIIYIMDVSASMGEYQKWLVRTTSFWINAWIKSHYKGVQTRYIIHDFSAQEVDEHRFFHTKESGGTLLSSGIDKCVDVIARDFNPDEWNIYVYQFSDGDNISPDDDEYCLSRLQQMILPMVNMYCYGQCLSFGTDEGHFIDVLEQSLPTFAFDWDANLATSRLYDDEDIYKTIKMFLGKG